MILFGLDWEEINSYGQKQIPMGKTSVRFYKVSAT